MSIMDGYEQDTDSHRDRHTTTNPPLTPMPQLRAPPQCMSCIVFAVICSKIKKFCRDNISGDMKEIPRMAYSRTKIIIGQTLRRGLALNLEIQTITGQSAKSMLDSSFLDGSLIQPVISRYINISFQVIYT